MAVRYALVRRTTFWIVGVSVVALSLAPALDARADDVVAECIGANERSLDLRKDGRLMDARRELAACAAPRCPEAIQQACGSRITDLNLAIPSVVFDVKDEAGQDMIDVRLAVDGHPAGTTGVAARQVDPGRHVFRFEAPGRSPVDKVLVLREGEKDRRESVQLGPSPTSPPKRPTAELAVAAPGRPADTTTTARPLRTTGWILGGTGLAAMAVGGALAVSAKVSYDGAPGCTGTVCTSVDGWNSRNAARTRGDAATIVTIAGAVATVAGLILWIAEPGAHETSSRGAWRVGLTPGGAVLRGGF